MVMNPAFWLIGVTSRDHIYGTDLEKLHSGLFIQPFQQLQLPIQAD